MKKIMIAVVTMAAAIATQAASINWATGTKVLAPESTAQAASGTLSMYVWLVDATTYSDTSVDSLWTSYGSKLSTATSSRTGGAGKSGVTVVTDGLSFSTTEATYYYALTLLTYDGNKDGTVEYYVANKAQSYVNTAGTGNNISSLATVLGGSGTTAVSWTAVPEPTSGLLMLLGMAGLALKRKRA